MKFRNLALITTSVAALGFSATASQAAPTMGEIYLGVAQWWDNYEFGSEGYDYNHPSLYGFGRVNIPYDGTKANLQLDFFGDSSLHDSGNLSLAGSRGNFGAGAHVNWRDSSEGLLGLYLATGRVWDIFGANNSPVFMAGLEGQYYCGHWTMYGQAGYMDSGGGFFIRNAGLVRGLLSYNASTKLKVTGGLGYIEGDVFGASATVWNWQAGGTYWFGKSVPVALTLKYEGRETEVDYSSSFRPKLNSNVVSIGFNFYFGGGSVEEVERTGAGTEIPNFDLFRVPGS